MGKENVKRRSVWRRREARSFLYSYAWFTLKSCPWPTWIENVNDETVTESTTSEFDSNKIQIEGYIYSVGGAGEQNFFLASPKLFTLVTLFDIFYKFPSNFLEIANLQTRYIALQRSGPSVVFAQRRVTLIQSPMNRRMNLSFIEACSFQCKNRY